MLPRHPYPEYPEHKKGGQAGKRRNLKRIRVNMFIRGHFLPEVTHRQRTPFSSRRRIWYDVNIQIGDVLRHPFRRGPLGLPQDDPVIRSSQDDF